MTKESKVHETAFLISMLRMTDPELSGDQYAHLWYNEKTTVWVDRLLHDVSSNEAPLHCLRNRFILDTIYQLYKAGEVSALINFGSGFSMYPFSLPADMVHVEIDQANIVEYKKARLDEWQAEQKLPKRQIHFISSDFNSLDSKSLAESIMTITKNKRTFILLEGVLYFLSRQTSNQLFGLFHIIQKSTGGYLGSVSYLDEMQHTPVYRRLLTYFEQMFGGGDGQQFQLVKLDFYKSLDHYQLMESTDGPQLFRQYLPHRPAPNPKNDLNENIYILKHIT